MAIIYKNLRANVVNLFPLIALYYLSISEIDTHFSNMFEILSFNLQIIINLLLDVKKFQRFRKWAYIFCRYYK